MIADLAEHVIALVEDHPRVRAIRLVGSRATGHARPESDWDFRVEVSEFPPLAEALPGLLRPLRPLAQQWDRLSDEQCWMLIISGPAKVDLIFPEEPHQHEPPWEPHAGNLIALDAHFWDWTLWLRSKEAAGRQELLTRELQKLSGHLLRPLGVDRVPSTIADAVVLYRAARADAERRFQQRVPRRLELQVAPEILAYT